MSIEMSGPRQAPVQAKGADEFQSLSGPSRGAGIRAVQKPDPAEFAKALTGPAAGLFKALGK